MRVFAFTTADGHRLDAVVDDRADPVRLVISTLLGCPIRCTFCDAGEVYEGRLTRSEMLAQLEVLHRHVEPPDRSLLVELTRMGEPAFNDEVLEVLNELPRRFGPTVRAKLSTVVPARTERFFERLEEVKRRGYHGGRLSIRFSLHATDPAQRALVTRTRLASFEEIAALGARLRGDQDERIELYFAPPPGVRLEPRELRRWFDPHDFRVTLAELRPTAAVVRRGLVSTATDALTAFRDAGYDTALDEGDPALDASGAACGMYTAEGREGGPRPRRTLRR